MAELSPMMQQYMDIKKQYKDEILFYRIGDFYEMFFDDALTASRELDLTLTGKQCGMEERAPMCGVPFHSYEGYVARLIAKGYKVAICEQMEDPSKAKGLVKRDIIRVVTPGTVIESSMLQDDKNNYIASIFLKGNAAGICFADVSTGTAHITELKREKIVPAVIAELCRYHPSEVLMNPGMLDCRELTGYIKKNMTCSVELVEEERYAPGLVAISLENQFGRNWDETTSIDKKGLVRFAMAALLEYLHTTQIKGVERLKTVISYNEAQYMQLSPVTRANLELTETLRGREKRGTLLWVLDKTSTAMGKRLLRTWIEQPLLSSDAINHRLDAVESLVNQTVQRGDLIEELHYIADLERMMTRTVYGSATPKEIYAMAQTCERLPSLRQQAESCGCAELSEIVSRIDPLSDIKDKIYAAVDPDAPSTLKDGGVIAKGYHPEVDELRSIRDNTKGVLAQLETRLRQETGIPKLKIGYNHVFGYFIEVSNSYKAQVPESYIRKQTLTNCERYITQELKDMEHTILSAQDRIVALEYQLFCDIRDQVAAQSPRIQEIAGAVAQVDVLVSFATVAAENNYCMPTVDNSDRLEITEGRHPVVETMRRDVLFVPNDTYMDNKEHLAAILTGPNMAGKSTYMRQVALMVLMAQMGSFVPARAARIGVVDRIFTRIGASDDLAGGQSTFMVEMTEVAELLKHATSRSLLILDEIGRGTSTYDGMSIARAVLEWCADPKRLGAKTLFATHYHELTVLEGELPGVKNFNIAARKKKDEILFLRKIVPGGADQSYGIEVANLAGLPPKVIRRAREILAELESQDKAPKQTSAREEPQVSLTALGEEEVLATLRNTQLESLTPLQAMNLLYELKAKL